MEQYLIDGVKLNAKNPDTFWIPTADERSGLQPGDFAKIGLEDEDGGERFWVIVKEETEDGTFVGAVDNDLVVFNLAYGERITFKPEHVLDTLHAEAA